MRTIRTSSFRAAVLAHTGREFAVAVRAGAAVVTWTAHEHRWHVQVERLHDRTRREAKALTVAVSEFEAA